MKITLNPVIVPKRQQYMDLLLLADESEEIVQTYIERGDLFAISLQNQTIGVALFIEEAPHVIELKNIALLPQFTGHGYGKAVIEHACTLYKRRNIHKLIVGTANSSIDNIAFYQKAGFRMTHVKSNFFLQYPAPIFENGIQALDMLMFERTL